MRKPADRMIAFPNAKINLGLNIIERRKDNFHNIETVFYPVPWNDVLEIIPAGAFSFTTSGISIPGAGDENLCVRIIRGLQEKKSFPQVRMHLHKLIPAGAGLGGGSADAAFTLKMVNELFQLRLSESYMEEFIAPYGSDCAFFIRNHPVFASGKGNLFESINCNLAGKWILMVYPDMAVSTKEAYAGVKPVKPIVSIREILGKNIYEWKELLVNDFEQSIFPGYPLLQKIKAQLYDMGAVYASMSGSGSTLYGIFESPVDIRNTFPQEYKILAGFLS